MVNKKNKDLFINMGIYLVLLLLLFVIITKEPTFLFSNNFPFINMRNITNILSQSSVRIIIALGVAGLIVTQGTDLSAGRQLGLAALISATLLQATNSATKVLPIDEVPMILVILLVVTIGAIIGIINGFIIAKLKVTPFIATLGTMIIVYGANSLYYEGIGASPVASFSEKYSNFAQGALNLGFINIPFIILYALIAIVFMWVLWNKTRFGKNIFAIGGNPEAAEVSGVNVTVNLIKVYALSGVFYAFAGFLEAARVGSVTNNMGNLYELDAIAACVVGGVSFSGGVGKISGVVTGVLIFTVINYGLTYINVSPYWQYIIKGLIIIAAVALDTMKYTKKR